jgi:hypothetical protein
VSAVDGSRGLTLNLTIGLAGATAVSFHEGSLSRTRPDAAHGALTLSFGP